MEYLVNYPKYREYLNNKKICLLGCGNSISKYNINFSEYDIIIGTNRIYKTDIGTKLNVLYHNSSLKDILNNKTKILNQLDYILFIPAQRSTYQSFNEFHKYAMLKYKTKIIVDFSLQPMTKQIFKAKLLTGVASLFSILQSSNKIYKKIDIYGFDFYNDGYYGNLRKFRQVHCIKKNKKILLDIINNNRNIHYFN